MPLPSLDEDIGPCLVWKRATTAGGYGVRGVGNKKIAYVHRLTWEEKRGPIPPGLFVLHRCDNRACYRVDHLFVGTQKDNAMDMARKGRGNFQKYPHMRRRSYDRQTRLSEDAVRAIRNSNNTMKQAAVQHGISTATVSRVRNHHTWKGIK